jgi:hypothetical protein
MLEGYFVVRRHRGWDRTFRKRRITDDKQVQNIVALHEHDLAALYRIKLSAEPIPSGLGDLASGDNEYVIDKDLPTHFRVEYLVPDHHGHLIHIRISATFELPGRDTPAASSLPFFTCRPK